MATNITERVIKLIALDNQLISVVENQGFLHHLEFLNPWYALLQRVSMLETAQFRGSLTAEHVKQATKEILNTCDKDKQRVHFILQD